jgi:hypothetical protein
MDKILRITFGLTSLGLAYLYFTTPPEHDETKEELLRDHLSEIKDFLDDLLAEYCTIFYHYSNVLKTSDEHFGENSSFKREVIERLHK